MTIRKQRLTITVDPDLVAAGNRAVADGRAGSLSGWVNAALRDRCALEVQLANLALAVAGYEEEFGEISDEEMEALRRADRETAVVVRGGAQRSSRSQRKGRGAA